ncbi:SDR family NAD(P)-dependent oxidoreductase [Marinifilum flexuosum]|uniref:NAD(P)-dependent dehydrogenase (Short-subunit alcohol dehydrogenase family) n=1 Tax=Marinifilum flexuosum TaxID=1117708 RepID=A0A419XA55_9BACT|nr:SDR family oxidoreductase [Marinifilum flexuosum]RKE04595.1 NAD(P)-dependent dehydrogenase (short-subunit alcohol dehydrogenase family) [Marinifilum flexuosum]
MNFNPFSLKDKVIVITGASSGIGQQCAIDCSKMGAKVALLGRDCDRLKMTISQMKNREKHLMFSVDLADVKCLKDVISTVVSSLGKVNGFIHAAGIEKTLPLKLTKQQDMKEVFDVNVISAVELLKILTSRKFKGDGQKHVLIASITGVIGRAGLTAYSASKGALISLTRSLALELAPRSINVNCVSPGTILTPMMESFLSKLSDDERIKRSQGFHLGLGKTTDVSNACIFLLSDAANWMTGQNIIIDGGYTSG